jgi:isoleucyl-tRNA synthetase
MSDSSAAAAAKNEKSGYRSTLNLPKTSFPMKANLVLNEPASLKRWQAMGLYERIQEARKDAEPWCFHDGPPYANGSIHLGHLMNKCLKDFVVRTRTMMGYRTPYVPGWDCHGLPIEHKVMTDLAESGKLAKLAELELDARRMAVRRECQKHATKHMKLQAEQMQRLLTLADYGHPYLTMTGQYEAAVLEVFAELVEQGLVYRALKSVHWSIANETALADAELEYYDREDISVYVDFECADAGAVYDAFEVGADRRPGVTPSLMIWTTTPWTLPANVAVAVNERFEYALVEVGGNVTVLAAGLVEKVAKAGGGDSARVLATARGTALLGLRYKHPFVKSVPRMQDVKGVAPDTSKVWSVVAADYVTLEDGTGLVHTATGHGVEDYQTGIREGIPVYCPVLENGTYDETAPEWLRGVSVWDANKLVTERLRQSGHLFHDHTFTHSYPHDWRSKTPVIFRATEQWFIGVDEETKRDGKTLREMALESISPETARRAVPPEPETARRAVPPVEFFPAWGRNRMRGMLESRPDWCISRQRAWGLPIPAFFAPDGEVLLTPASVRAVAAVVREKGSDAWFQLAPDGLLAGYDLAGDPHAPSNLETQDSRLKTLRKGEDIFDVWFESGSSWNAVLREREAEAGAYPAELYLEGSDQHRGWFQLSLLPSLGAHGIPPFKRILTHGFMVDKDGLKLSKSKGDTIEALFQDFGSDVLRWWVCSLSYENDVKVDREFFSLAGESYRKVRNTLRFMLSNLDDFDGSTNDAVNDFPATSIDAWVLGEYDKLAAGVIAAYERFDFQAAHKLLYNFCNETLSAVYLAAVKDRLYCDKPDSERRRRTQGALWALTDGLCRLLAPVLCHTADEAYRALLGADAKDDECCVHVGEFVRSFDAAPDDGFERVMAVRDVALVALERTKGDGMIENPLDAGVVLPDPDGVLARFEGVDLADLLGVSRVRVDSGASEIVVEDLRSEPRCERSWKRDGTVRLRSDGGMLSDRDAEAVGVG